MQEYQIEISKLHHQTSLNIAPSNKTEYDSKGIAPSFESHFKEPKRKFQNCIITWNASASFNKWFRSLSKREPNRKFKIASSLAMIK